MRFASIAGLVAALALTIGVQTAMAEAQPAQRTDPKAESPAGVIYQIPLDSARRDSSPVLPTGRKKGGGGGGTGAATGAAGSSKNRTSTAAGGTGSSAKGAGAGGGGDPEANQGTSQDPSSIHSENGFGSASQVPGLSEAALRTGAGVAATQTAGSTTPTFLFIALIAAAAIGIGVLATRHSRLRSGQPPSTHDV